MIITYSPGPLLIEFIVAKDIFATFDSTPPSMVGQLKIFDRWGGILRCCLKSYFTSKCKNFLLFSSFYPIFSLFRAKLEKVKKKFFSRFFKTPYWGAHPSDLAKKSKFWPSLFWTKSPIFVAASRPRLFFCGIKQ